MRFKTTFISHIIVYRGNCKFLLNVHNAGVLPHWFPVNVTMKRWNSWTVSLAWKVSKYGAFSGPYFPVFGLNTKRYRVKIRTRKTPYLNTFHTVINLYSYILIPFQKVLLKNIFVSIVQSDGLIWIWSHQVINFS